MKIAISQSMFFPWVGLLEQIRLSDIFVHYDDVQFSKGSFTNRVQIKIPEGLRWLTIPLEEHRLGQKIEEVGIKPSTVWLNKHIELLEQSFEGAPFAHDALAIVSSVYEKDYDNIGSLARNSLLALCNYFGLSENCDFIDVKDMNISGKSTDRVLSVVKALNGDQYITGHGAKNYLNHELFDCFNIQVMYMDYLCVPYSQLHGPFTSYVSSLDLVANCGQNGISKIRSNAIYWRDFLNESA